MCVLFFPSNHTKSYYVLPRELLPYNESKAACERLNAELVLPNSPDEQAYISNTYVRNSNDRFWINAIAVQHVNVYIAGSGKPLNFDNFTVAPSCGTSCCAAIFDATKRWRQSDCLDHNRVLCQKNTSYSNGYILNEKGFEYRYYETAKTYDEANSFCDQNGGHLVTVKWEDLNFLRYVSNNKSFWTGGKYYDGDSINGINGWYWADGVRLSEQFRIRPDDCLYYKPSLVNEVWFENCGIRHSFICQRRTSSTGFLWGAARDHDSRVTALEIEVVDIKQAIDGARDHIVSLLANHTYANNANATVILNSTEIQRYLFGIEQRLEVMQMNHLELNSSVTQIYDQLFASESGIARSSNWLIRQLDQHSQSITRNDIKIYAMVFLLILILLYVMKLRNELQTMKLEKRALSRIQFLNMKHDSCEAFVTA